MIIDQPGPTARHWAEGAPEDMLSRSARELPIKSKSICENREIQLFEQTGFGDIELFYAAVSWRDWVAFAADQSRFAHREATL